MSSELSHINLRYDNEHLIRCRAVRGPDDYTPFNFLNYFPEDEAKSVLLDCARYAGQVALKYREEPTDHAILLPDIEKVGKFVSYNLGVKPIGKLAYVERLGDSQDWGVTYHQTRKSYVIRDSILKDEHGRLKELGVPRDVVVGSVAVHELVHLAGLPDWVFFSTNPDKGYRYVNYVDAAPTMTTYDYTRNQRSDGQPGGWFWEEGVATLSGSLYAWNQWPTLAHNTQTTVRQAPDGTRVHLPIRHTVNKNYQAFAGWGMERLTALVPKAWGVLIRSRKPDATWQTTRKNLKECLDAASLGLFEQIDQVTGSDLSEIVQAADRIDREAKLRRV
jgi:hypothetical protein